jgi:hypothetical protein
MENTAVKKFRVDAQHSDGAFERHECEGYLLLHKHRNAVVLTGAGTFSNANYVAALQCLKTVMGEERFEMALAAMDTSNYVSLKVEALEGVGV